MTKPSVIIVGAGIGGLTTALYQLQTHSVNNFLPRQIVGGASWDVTATGCHAGANRWRNSARYCASDV